MAEGRGDLPNPKPREDIEAILRRAGVGKAARQVGASLVSESVLVFCANELIYGSDGRHIGAAVRFEDRRSVGSSYQYVLRDSELVWIVRDVIPGGFPPRRRFSVLNADLAEIATVSQSEDPNRYEIAVGGRRSATIPHSRPVTPRRSSGSRRSLSLLGRANALIDRWLARVWVIEGVSGDQLATVTYLAGAYVLELDPRADNAHRAAAVAFCLMIRGGDGGGSGVIDIAC